VRKWWLGAAALVAVLAVFASYVGSSAAHTQKTTVNTAVSGSVSFDGIWTGSEATAFGQVIKAFNKLYPNVHINYKPVGNNVPTVLATAIAGGHPPDMADIAQPGLVKQLSEQGHLRARVACARHVQRQAVRARLQGGQQVAALVQRTRLQGRRRQGTQDVEPAAGGRQHAEGIGHPAVLGRRL